MICKKNSIWKGTFDKANLALPSMACTSLRLPWATAAWRASIFCMYLPTTSSQYPAPQQFGPKDLPWDGFQKLAHFGVRGILWQQFVTLVSTYLWFGKKGLYESKDRSRFAVNNHRYLDFWKRWWLKTYLSLKYNHLKFLQGPISDPIADMRGCQHLWFNQLFFGPLLILTHHWESTMYLGRVCVWVDLLLPLPR